MLAIAGAALVIQTVIAAEPGEADAAPPPVAAQGTLTHRLPLMGITKDGQNPASQSSFISSATAVVSGGRVTITARVRSVESAVAVFDVETIGPGGQRVDQQYRDNTTFTAGGEQEITFTWTPPPGSVRGAYAVRIGLFEPGKEWKTLYHWNDSAGRFDLP